MVLPSNASPLTHPQNSAADYCISWDTAIELNPNDNWKVALTEACYTYHPHTISTNLSIEYERMETKIIHKEAHYLRFNNHLIFSDYTFGKSLNGQEIIKFDTECYVKDRKYVTISAKSPFSVEIPELGLSGMAHTDTETPGLYTSVGTVNLITVYNEPGVRHHFL